MIRTLVFGVALAWAVIANANEVTPIATKDETAQCVADNLRPLVLEVQDHPHLFHLDWLTNKALGRSPESAVTQGERDHLLGEMADVMARMLGSIEIHFDSIELDPKRRWRDPYTLGGKIDLTVNGKRSDYEFELWLRKGFCQLKDVVFYGKSPLTVALREHYRKLAAETRG